MAGSNDILGRDNNFGFLRLFFAALVVVGHSPELTGGGFASEWLREIFGTLSFGEIAVDAFFIISGYLITKSFLSPQPLSRFILSRVLRIYPGYIVAFVISFYIVGAVSGGDISSGLGLGFLKQLRTMALIGQPDVPNAFADSPIPLVNGPMWSLTQEFRCYILVVLLGLASILRRRLPLAVLIVAGLLLLSFHSFAIVRMASIFFCGMGFYIFRREIPYRRDFACLAAVAWCVLMFFPRLAEPATALLGAYIIFWFAFAVRSPRLSRIGRNVDVSFGMYLYAWPISKLLVMYFPSISAVTLTAATLVPAAATGYLSWTLIEKPALSLKDNPWLLSTLDGFLSRGHALLRHARSREPIPSPARIRRGPRP